MNEQVFIQYVLRVSDHAAAWLAEHDQERDCLDRFVSLMVEELAANDGKGNRPGWLQMDRKEAMAEIGWHLAKLQVAAKRLDTLTPFDANQLDEAEDEISEYAADVANCALMALDCLSLLTPEQPANDRLELT